MVNLPVARQQSQGFGPPPSRYRLSRRTQIVEEYFASVSAEYDWSPRYNMLCARGTRPDSESALLVVGLGALG